MGLFKRKKSAKTTDYFDIVMNSFVICGYDFDEETFVAKFHYTRTQEYEFCEEIHFIKPEGNMPDDRKELLHRALSLAAVLIGTSYYKAHPTKDIWTNYHIDDFQKEMFDAVYQEGLSQFAFENHLNRADLGTFTAVADFSTHNTPKNSAMELATKPLSHQEETSQVDHRSGILALQSGGKDSILTATMLNEAEQSWTALYISSEPGIYPKVLDQLGAKEVQVVTRIIDKNALKKAANHGGLNGHVPVTFINMAIALAQAIINGDNTILTSIGHEGAEPHTIISSPKGSGLPDLEVNHQWSKTWEAEQLFTDYIHKYLDASITIGSPLRKYSELKIAELFAMKCWNDYGHLFSSCNQANYRQGNDNSALHWCGECAKCANSYLLFAPFLEPTELDSIFPEEKSLFKKPELEKTFKGLLSIDREMKPFECIGEIPELRRAYHMKKESYPDLPFSVPESNFDYEKTYPSQKFIFQ